MENRRNFIAWVIGFLGFGATASFVEAEQPEVKMIQDGDRRIFYVDVGNMSPRKAEEFMDKIKLAFKNNRKQA